MQEMTYGIPQRIPSLNRKASGAGVAVGMLNQLRISVIVSAPADTVRTAIIRAVRIDAASLFILRAPFPVWLRFIPLCLLRPYGASDSWHPSECVPAQRQIRLQVHSRFLLRR